jgi:hypothetical protein
MQPGVEASRNDMKLYIAIGHLSGTAPLHKGRVS